MKITSLKVANAVKVGGNELTHFSEVAYLMKLDGSTVRIEDRRQGDVTFTSLFNTIWWKGDDSAAAAHSVVSGTQAKGRKAFA